MAKVKKYKKDNLYRIKFWDHSTGDAGVLLCTVVGFCFEDSDRSVRVTHWIVHSDDKDVVKENREPTNILKCCIVKSERL